MMSLELANNRSNYNGSRMSRCSGHTLYNKKTSGIAADKHLLLSNGCGGGAAAAGAAGQPASNMFFAGSLILMASLLPHHHSSSQLINGAAGDVESSCDYLNSSNGRHNGGGATTTAAAVDDSYCVNCFTREEKSYAAAAAAGSSTLAASSSSSSSIEQAVVGRQPCLSEDSSSSSNKRRTGDFPEEFSAFNEIVAIIRKAGIKANQKVTLKLENDKLVLTEAKRGLKRKAYCASADLKTGAAFEALLSPNQLCSKFKDQKMVTKTFEIKKNGDVKIRDKYDSPKKTQGDSCVLSFAEARELVAQIKDIKSAQPKVLNDAKVIICSSKSNINNSIEKSAIIVSPLFECLSEKNLYDWKSKRFGQLPDVRNRHLDRSTAETSISSSSLPQRFLEAEALPEKHNHPRSSLTKLNISAATLQSTPSALGKAVSSLRPLIADSIAPPPPTLRTSSYSNIAAKDTINHSNFHNSLNGRGYTEEHNVDEATNKGGDEDSDEPYMKFDTIKCKLDKSWISSRPSTYQKDQEESSSVSSFRQSNQSLSDTSL